MTDVVITVADVLSASGADKASGTAGATITAGDCLYSDASDGGKLKPADCTTSALTANVVGIARHGALDEQPVSYQTGGNIDPGGTVAVGTVYVLSEDGAMAPYGDLAQNDYVTIIGIGTTASNLRMLLHTSGVQVP